jgi:hypothetical protein
MRPLTGADDIDDPDMAICVEKFFKFIHIIINAYQNACPLSTCVVPLAPVDGLMCVSGNGTITVAAVRDACSMLEGIPENRVTRLLELTVTKMCKRGVKEDRHGPKFISLNINYKVRLQI